MRPGLRSLLLLLALALLAPFAWQVAKGLPQFGSPTAAYGATVNALGPPLRHVSNMVAAVNFDFRALDTLGEESMLFCAVTGAVVLLRGTRGEGTTQRAGLIPGRAVLARSDAQVLVCRIACTLTMLFGLYMVLHGTVTPGGGFQGGVIIASAVLLLYLAEGYGPWRRLIRSPLLDVLESLGVLLFVGAGAAPLLSGHAAMSNLMPLGHFRDLFSGGVMLVTNFAVGLAVAAGFVMLLLEFLEETRTLQSDSLPDEAQR